MSDKERKEGRLLEGERWTVTDKSDRDAWPGRGKGQGGVEGGWEG